MSLNEPKAKMGLNDAKWAQKTLNLFKMILYELKIGLNELRWESLNKSKEPKCAQMRLNELKF